MDTTPRLHVSRRALLWRTTCALLFCAATGLLALVLSNAVWILHTSPSDEEPSQLLAAYSIVPSLAVIGFVLCLTQRVRPRITFLGFLISAGLIAILATDDIRRSEPPDYGPVAAIDFGQRGSSVFALRNPVGHKLTALSAPRFEHLTKLWEQEDVRRTLFERLKIQPAATAP